MMTSHFFNQFNFGKSRHIFFHSLLPYLIFVIQNVLSVLYFDTRAFTSSSAHFYTMADRREEVQKEKQEEEKQTTQEEEE